MTSATAHETGTTTIRHLDRLLREQDARRPKAPAILAPGLPALTYRALLRQAERTARDLAAAGVARTDRVAIALPGGPCAATALVAVARAATAAPLDPAGRAREFDALFTDMDVRAVLVQRGTDSHAAAVARAQGRLVVELVPDAGGAAGEFALVPDTPAPAPDPRTGDPDDTAFLMHTSGTTGRPKLVPQSHALVCASARNIAASLDLGEADRCLNVLPLFHGHGLMSPLLATLWAGASVVCPPAFDAAAFPDWLRTFEPTWYTAVPAIHQAVAGVLAGHPDARSAGLRFVRSASAPFPERLREALEEATGAVVIDSYGMTEACSIITSNPLPPRARKPGSVGVSVGNELAVRGEDGTFLPPGEEGEIVLRGETVISRYDDNPEADAKAFTDGWFGTGDSGYLDEDGYLFLTGRLKEIINRGGTKVSPVEVDEVLLAHPDVVEAAAFPLPHATLGEEVAAALVLAPGAHPTDEALHDFLAARLAEPKIPRRLFRVERIPRTSTGKIQRSGLAAHLERPDAAHPAAPGTDLESAVAAVWCELLGLEQVGVRDHFFDLGGNSLLIRRAQVLLKETTGRDVPVVELFAHPTVETLAAHLAAADGADEPDEGRARAEGNRRLALQRAQRRQQTEDEI
ncbi:non-ribosomal peptide synthetase [Streptomyces roseirectus]|uniref:Non-ribosomal peptide synthetase n=1 Tax=Streptomyces roseirectus TaxID=2768066 RepID=A0A7H0IN69_9ACTN|nr:non-ribosomal peptide synthetase [Streptomyces roseirectus]QNP74235.1 non-ribosomal peptide synthetase [Streptomyces roseirectus]